MRTINTFIACSLLFGALPISAGTAPSTAKDMLKNQIAGSCENPELAFPSPPPVEKMAMFKRWCDCIQQAVDALPDEKLEQTKSETFEEYSAYRKDPKNFIPTKEYSLIRISKNCSAQAKSGEQKITSGDGI